MFLRLVLPNTLKQMRAYESLRAFLRHHNPISPEFDLNN